MHYRGRYRDVDDDQADTINPPLTVQWVTGRFYDGSVQVGGLGTAVMLTNVFTTPILIPHPVIVTSIGVEATVASSAGGLLRFAIYDSDPVSCMPRYRRVDSGTVASDATGFLSASISVMLYAGWHWLSVANFASPTSVTVRTHGNGVISIGAYQYASSDNPAQAPAQGIRLASQSGVVNIGFPQQFFNGNIGGNVPILEATTTQYPRTMIGV